MTNAPLHDVFGGVDLWIFDLDNTLYPYPPGLWAQVDTRMGTFISTLLEVDRVEAKRVQKDYFRQYGLTMRGLMERHGVAPQDFLGYVHDVDLSVIAPNPALGEGIARLPGRRVIHTNSDTAHTSRVLAQLGIPETLFDAVYDIEATGYQPKPGLPAYDHVLREERADAARAAMFEDSARNLLEPHRRGMRTVLTPTSCDVASQGSDGAHVQFITHDITRFVTDIAEALE